MDIPVYPLKQGATLSLWGSVPLPGPGWTATAKLKRRDPNTGALLDFADLDVTLLAPVAPATDWTLGLVKDATSTATWSIDSYYVDVRFQSAAFVSKSSTIIISLQEAVTP
jgi:hypothetical protein